MQELTLHIDNHETEIVIGHGLFDRLEAYSGKRLIFLVDLNVYELHRSAFNNRKCIVVPPGEKQKTLDFAENVMRQMVRMEADRTTFLVGVGGGLVSDLAGFVASVYMRGISFGFISSTLLGQVDASIGGKNGVNLDGFKNMIGIIRQPEFVWCDLQLLDSLDQKEMISGYAEVIKYGAIYDRGLFEILEQKQKNILDRDPAILEEIVTRSVAIKRNIVENDVTEQGERKLLNFGHTLGHAVEKLTGMLHGYAVGTGMVLEARLSVNMGLLDQKEADRLEKLIASAGLPVKADPGMNSIYDALLKDKKRAGDQIYFVLLEKLGKAVIHRLDLSILKKSMDDLH